MNFVDTKKAFQTAERAFARARRAKTCGLAANNMRLGQKQLVNAFPSYRKHVPASTEWRMMSPVQRDLFELWIGLANQEGTAHENRLAVCGTTQTAHELAALQARMAVDVDGALNRRERKRPKKR